MNEVQDPAETAIENVRREVLRRRGVLETAAQPAPPPSTASLTGAALQKARAAVNRAKTKQLRARKWPRLLRPLRRNQETVNDGLIAATEALLRQVEFLTRTLAPLPPQQSRLATQLQHCAEDISSLGGRFQALETLLQAPQLPPEPVDAFYTAFEDEFRGSSELIRERLRDFLPFLEDLRERTPSSAAPAALDIGCGRGEWLQMLGKNGFDARGVDLNAQMVEICLNAGLRAQKADMLEHLRHTPDGSLALVSGFHIVEHLEFTKLLSLFHEIHRALMPGGIALFETPNPECSRVASYTFYMDPTHRNPVPMELLSFIATHTGFSATQVERLHPYCEDGKLQGYGDYAAIFTK